MSIYISKNAIQNIPLLSEILDEKFYSNHLNSSLLKSSDYLVKLANGGEAVSLAINSKSSLKNQDAIKVIKMALEAIDDNYTEYNLPSNYFTSESNSGIFDEELKDALKIFQLWCGLPDTGILDKITLLKIDEKLKIDFYVDYIKAKYIGNNLSDIRVIQEFENTNNQLKYSFDVFVNDVKINVETDKIVQGQVVKKNDTVVTSQDSSVFVKFDKEIVDNIKNNPIYKNLSFDNKNLLENNDIFKIKPDNLKTIYRDNNNNISLTPITLENALNELPPIKYKDPNEKAPYLIKAGDTFNGIITENYYNAYTIVNPYHNVPIFTIPQRQPLANKSEDARFQFYTNLLYYINSHEDDGVVKEYGIKAVNGYQRYNEDHLDSINVYDNLYDSSNPETALPNYYRFLKKMEAIQPSSKIIYNASGENTSFQLQVGKKIRIPSKQFADSLYYELNFRHDKFLVPDISSTIGGLMVAPAFNEIITSMTTSISDVLKQEVIDLYKETCQFFINAFNFTKNFLTLHWLPRGTGGVIGKGFGLTFTSATVEINQKSTLWRKMTPVDQLNIMYKDELTLGAGPDITYGVNLGLYFGKGTKKKGIGIQAGAGANAQLNFKLNAEYEFPIRAQETALLAMVVTVFGGPVVQSISDILDYLKITNLDPKKYVTKYECAVEANSEAWLAAEGNFGTIDSDNAINVADTPVNDTNTPNKGFFTLDKLLKMIPSLGFSASITRSFGLGFSIEYEYDQNCLIPSIDARVPEKIKTEIFFQSKSASNVEAIGNTLSKIIFGATGVPTALNTILGFLFGNSNKKYSLLFEGKRNVHGKEINYDDVSIHNFSTSQVNVTNNQKGGLKYQKNNNKFTWESYFRIGYFSGDPEEFCQPGSFSAIKINLSEIKNLYNSNSLSLSQILKIFYSYEYGFKLGHGIDGRNRKGLNVTQKVLKSYRTAGTTTSFNYERAIKNVIFSTVYKNYTIQAGAFVYVKIELEMNKILPIVKYYLKVAKLKFENPENIDFIEDILNPLINHRSKVIEAINKKVKTEQPLNEEQLLNKLGAQYFELLFSESTTPIYGNVVGMNAFIDQLPSAEINFGNAMKVFVDSYKFFLQYYSDIKLKDQEKHTYGIHDIATAFSYTKNLVNLFVALEVELGIAVSTSLKVGELASFGISLAGELAIIVNSTFYENGTFVLPYNPNDDLNQAHQEIKDKIYNEVLELQGRIQEVKKSLVRHLISDDNA